MKRLFVIVAFVALSVSSAYAWSTLGHEVVIAVAQRHLTEKTKENIAKYIAYDLKKDAVWMDYHRHDEPIAYTTNWHTCYFDENFNYAPLYPRKAAVGDVVRSIQVVEAYFRNHGYKNLDEETVIFNIRMLIHFMGDAHCPTHNYFDGLDARWACELNGKKYKKFHSVYDRMPALIWGKTPADEVAAKIDNASKREIKRIVAGTVYDWMSDSARNIRQIYDWNPKGTEILRDDTVELSTEMVNEQMRNAGYRLAYLLNLYFGK